MMQSFSVSRLVGLRFGSCGHHPFANASYPGDPVDFARERSGTRSLTAARFSNGAFPESHAA